MRARLLIIITTCILFSSLFTLNEVDALIMALSLEDLAEKAEFVVIGKVTEIFPLIPGHLLLFTDGYDGFQFDVTLSVEDDLDGKYGKDTITFRVHDSREDFGMHIEDEQNFEVGERVLVFIGEKEPDSVMGDAYLVYGVTQGKYLLQDGIAFGTHFPEGIDEDELISKIKDIRLVDSFVDDSPNPQCNSGPSLGENFVFIDCNWVKIPHGWIFENGRWQEDPNIQRLGPAPLPTCPRKDICTCSGEYNFYNSSEKQCYSSPYPTSEHLKLCEKFKEMDFEGWHFREDVCEWIKTDNPYEIDEQYKLASSKVTLGGTGINPEFDLSIILIGVSIGIGIVVFMTLYWKKRK